MIELFKTLAAFTPTEKDDQFIDSLQKFLDENPELASVIIKILLGLIKAK